MKQNDLIIASVKDLLPEIASIIENTLTKTALFLNVKSTLMYWGIGHFINSNLKGNNCSEYCNKIVATVSQQLKENFGKGFAYTVLTSMCNYKFRLITKLQYKY